LAPYIAKEYSKAKLVLIATGPYLNIKPGLFSFVFNLARNNFILRLLNLYKYLPGSIQTFLYQKIMPFRGKRSGLTEYEADMKSNIESLLRISFEKQIDLINFIDKTDNSNLLTELKNRTLIFAGTNDLLMPMELSEKLHKLIKGSILKVNKGEHFDVFTESNYKDLDKFLK
jgi:pimeloyl-ACP methyl ester carboxylesterase